MAYSSEKVKLKVAKKMEYEIFPDIANAALPTSKTLFREAKYTELNIPDGVGMNVEFPRHWANILNSGRPPVYPQNASLLLWFKPQYRHLDNRFNGGYSTTSEESRIVRHNIPKPLLRQYVKQGKVVFAKSSPRSEKSVPPQNFITDEKVSGWADKLANAYLDAIVEEFNEEKVTITVD